MFRDFIWTVIIRFLKKGEKEMMAMFFAQRVILGKTAFKDVPKALKQGCAEVLLESGLPELVPVSYGGTCPDEAMED